MEKQLYYFGCMNGIGHYWYPHRPTSLPGVNSKIFNVIDGPFLPGHSTKQGAGQEVIVGPLRILAWHDYTVDSRPGSNSVLVGLGYANAEEMYLAAETKFPTVTKRQPVPPIFIINV